MQVIHKLAPSKAWRLAQNTVTGQVYTDHNSLVYCGKPDQQQNKIDKAKAAFALDGTLTPDGSQSSNGVWNPTTRSYEYPTYTGPSLHDVVLFDHIPVMRLQCKFKRLYHGNSDVAVRFETPTGHPMLMRGSSSNEFFTLVGSGKIEMDSAGFYEFVVSFVKAGEKVYMELYGY